MARNVTHTARGPFELKPQKTSAWICMCGLSKNKPFCDGSHKKTEGEEEKVYEYAEDGTRNEICSKDSECCGACKKDK